MLLDDFEDENNTLTTDARAKNANLITAVVYPALEPHTGRLRINGTPVHYDSFINNLIANSEKDFVTAFTNYGKFLGLCFQLTDDLLDYIGDEESLGKKIGKVTSAVYSPRLERNIALAIVEIDCANLDQILTVNDGNSEFIAVVVNKLLQDINNETINKLSITRTKGMAINFAQCCYPIPGDEVTGVLSTMRGLVLHRTNCSQLEHIKEKNSQWMEVDWQSDDSEQFEVGISCIVENRSGRLAAIANTVANLGVNIENIEQQRRPDSTRLFHIVVVVSNIIELNNVLDKLNNLAHVVSAGRL